MTSLGIISAVIGTIAAIFAAIYARLALKPAVIQRSQHQFVELRRHVATNRARLSRDASIFVAMLKKWLSRHC